MHQQPTEFRTFQNAVINNAGPFFNLLSKTRFEGYNPASHQSQDLQILHELAHLVFFGGAPLIPDDGGEGNQNKSEDNTKEVLKHCKGELDKSKELMKHVKLSLRGSSMFKAVEKFLICIVITMQILPAAGRTAQVRKRLICGKVVLNPTAAVAQTVVSVSFGLDQLLPGAVAEQDGTFCIENYVSDVNKSTSARLYVTSFCHPEDVTLVDIPFWPHLRRRTGFAGKRILIGPGTRTSVGDVHVQITYGHVSLRILDERLRPLLTNPSDWSPVWIRVRDQNGVIVHESGLSAAEIERWIDLKESRINLALPEGQWRLEVALAGVPPGTSINSRAVPWRHVPGKLRIESCRQPVEANLSVTRKKSPKV